MPATSVVTDTSSAAIGIVLVAEVLLSSGLPQRAQLAASWSGLNAAAGSCAETGENSWAEIIRLDEVEPGAGVHCFLYRYGSFLNRDGFVRLPDGPPADPRRDWNMTVTHLDGDWYRFVWHF